MRRGTHITEAGVKDVLKRIERRVRDWGLAERLKEKVLRYQKTKSDRDDLTLPESGMVYGPIDYGEVLPLSKKRKLDIDWTNHAEYRSELRDIDPKEMNEDIRDWLKERLQKKGPDRKKVRMKTPEGTAVVDYDTTSKPSDADVITVWGSKQAAKVMTEDEYILSKGVDTFPPGEPGLHRTPRRLPKTQQRQNDRMLHQRQEKWQKQVDKLRAEYRQKVMDGDVRPPSRTERYLNTAKGHPDKSSVQAARRILRKMGLWSDEMEKEADARFEMAAAASLLREASDLLAADPKFNLKSKYRYWNAKAFGGELPPIPIKWMRSKTMGGRVRATRRITDPVTYRLTGKAEIKLKDMAISNFLVMNEERLDGIMLHEMVHVYVLGILGLAEKRGGHGREFLTKLREVKSKTGVDIPLTEDITGMAISEDVPTKPMGVLLGINRSGQKLMQVFSVRALIQASREIPERLEQLGYKWFAILQSKDRELMKYPAQRKLSRKWYVIDQSELNRVMSSPMVLIDEQTFRTASVTAKRKRKKRPSGQLETWKSVRKSMPPPTKKFKRKDRKTRKKEKEEARRHYR